MLLFPCRNDGVYIGKRGRDRSKTFSVAIRICLCEMELHKFDYNNNNRSFYVQSGIVLNPILTEIAIKVRTGRIVMVLMNKN